jgi:hypothetical protein
MPVVVEEAKVDAPRPVLLADCWEILLLFQSLAAAMSAGATPKEPTKKYHSRREPPPDDDSPTSKAFGIALLKVVDGEPGVTRHLSTITGLSIDGIKGRVKRARYDY